MNSKVKVLFVCLGNICRSPTAHGVFREKVKAAGLADEVFIDSAGTGDWHVGAAPDARATAAAKQRGYALHDLLARQVTREDFEQFDYILAMDKANLRDLRKLQPANFKGKLQLFLDVADGASQAVQEVPDPYFGGVDGFESVLDLIEAASEKLLQKIRLDVAVVS